jgi:hypothetical protein
MLQGELHAARMVTASSAAVVAERNASIALIRKQLEKALEDKMASSIA